jgi:hypothetical protein
VHQEDREPVPGKLRGGLAILLAVRLDAVIAVEKNHGGKEPRPA